MNEELADARRIDRRLGWIISLGGAALLLGQGPALAASAHDYPLIWNVGVAVLAAVVLIFAAVGWLLPHGLLRVGWTLAPVLGMGLQLLAFAGYSGPVPPTDLPWILAFDASLVTYLMLWLPTWAAIGGTVMSSMFVAMSGLVFLGDVPHVIAVATPIHMANIIFIAIFAGVRANMLAQSAARRRARMTLDRRVRATIEAHHQERLSRVIHDEVLSVLTAASSVRQGTPPQLRAGAARALELLASTPESGHRDHPWRDDTLARLTATAVRIDPTCRMDTAGAEAMVPSEVSDAVVAAAGEAMRNSVRHAGPDASRSLTARVAPGSVEVVIADDGIGFDPRELRPGALGIEDSILTRMRSLPGGDATISSDPGLLTTVVVSWQG